MRSPLTGVLARNRLVIEGNTVDVNSVKWYLPAVNQYLIIWMGQNRLQEDTRLMDESLFDVWTVDNQMDHSQHYYTSSSDAYRLYWQDQGASWGKMGAWTTLYEGSKDLKIYRNHIRCVRNLRTTKLDDIHKKEYGEIYDKNHPVVFPVYVEENSRIINCENLENLRPNYMTGRYNVHYERDEENKVYSRFEVADPSIGHFNGDIIGIPNINNVCCMFSKAYCTGKEDTGLDTTPATCADDMNEYAAAYYQNTDKSDLGQWRVPNQRELMLMFVCDNNTGNLLPTNYVSILSTTWFSVTSIKRTYPFKYEAAGASANINISNKTSGFSPALLFVRDVK